MAWFVLLGLIVTMLAWRLVTVRGRDVWITIPPLLGVLGLASILLWSKVPAPAPAGSNVPGAIGVLAIGAATGIALYIGTPCSWRSRQRIPSFARQTADRYQRAGTADPRRSFSCLCCSRFPGEELFWRGIASRGAWIRRDGGRGRRSPCASCTCSRTCRAGPCRSSPARWWAARCGARSRGGRAASSRRSRAISFGPD